jgi:hypothetical protein
MWTGLRNEGLDMSFVMALIIIFLSWCNTNVYLFGLECQEKEDEFIEIIRIEKFGRRNETSVKVQHSLHFSGNYTKQHSFLAFLTKAGAPHFQTLVATRPPATAFTSFGPVFFASGRQQTDCCRSSCVNKEPVSESQRLSNRHRSALFAESV